jgi:hypothetical protein
VRGTAGVSRQQAALGALLVLAAGSWVALMTASSRTLYVEPTDEAVSRASAARPSGLVAAALLLLLVLAASVLAGRRWMAVLALPGVLAGGWLLLAPGAHGAAFLSGLAGSLAAAAVSVWQACRTSPA